VYLVPLPIRLIKEQRVNKPSERSSDEVVFVVDLHKNNFILFP
jgi:hypothetical protein